MKPHGFLVYLPPELYVAVVRLQADKGLGRVYPVLYVINEGLYKLGYIKDEVHEIYEKKYSEPLVQKKPKALTIEELREHEKIEQLEKHFSEVLKQWPRLKEKARLAHVVRAKEYADRISNAKLVVALANGNCESI